MNIFFSGLDQATHQTNNIMNHVYHANIKMINSHVEIWKHTHGFMQDTNDLINVCIELPWYVVPKHKKYLQLNKMTEDYSKDIPRNM